MVKKKVINNISLHLTKSKVFCNLKGKILSYRLILIYQAELPPPISEFFKKENIAVIK